MVLLLVGVTAFAVCLTVYCKRKATQAAAPKKDIIYDTVGVIQPPLPASRVSQAQYSLQTQPIHYTNSLEENGAYGNPRSNQVINGSVATRNLEEAAAGNGGNTSHSNIAMTGNIAYRNGDPSEENEGSTSEDNDGYEVVNSPA